MQCKRCGGEILLHKNFRGTEILSTNNNGEVIEVIAEYELSNSIEYEAFCENCEMEYKVDTTEIYPRVLLTRRIGDECRRCIRFSDSKKPKKDKCIGQYSIVPCLGFKEKG